MSSGNTSLNSTRIENFSMRCSLSASMSHIFIANNLQPFLMHFFACKADTCLTKTFFGMHWIFTWFPWLSVHNIDLCNQLSMSWCCSNQSMPISIPYDHKGKIFKFTLVVKPFKFTSQYLTISETYHFVPMANCTGQVLSCFSFPSLHT